MITQSETLVDAARHAGIEIPPDLHDFDKSKYPYWNLYCIAQIDRPMPDCDSHLRNAHVIADIDPDRIDDIGFSDIVDYLE